MRKAAFSLTLLGLAAAWPALAREQPLIVELFTAQGCSSCGEASEHLADLTEMKGVLPLTFSVDYWDYLGWPDTFAEPEFAERQKAYAKKLGPREVYTPQVVVGGREQVAGSRTERIDALVQAAAETQRWPPDMLFMDNGKIAIGSGRRPAGGAEVWLIRYEPGPIEVDIRKGDNRGETIVGRNVVRELTRLGEWRGRPTAFRLPEADTDGLHTLVIVQQAGGGPIIAALEQPSDDDAK